MYGILTIIICMVIIGNRIVIEIKETESILKDYIIKNKEIKKYNGKSKL